MAFDTKWKEENITIGFTKVQGKLGSGEWGPGQFDTQIQTLEMNLLVFPMFWEGAKLH